LQIEASELRPALDQASLILADVLGADTVDIFLYRADKDTLVALGTSDTPMGRAQHAHGLDRLPVANGGPVVDVFLSGQCYFTGHSEQDPSELKGIVETLGVRSLIAVPLVVDGERRNQVAARMAGNQLEPQSPESRALDVESTRTAEPRLLR
jgi:GAF domain-containing protein